MFLCCWGFLFYIALFKELVVCASLLLQQNKYKYQSGRPMTNQLLKASLDVGGLPHAKLSWLGKEEGSMVTALLRRPPACPRHSLVTSAISLVELGVIPLLFHGCTFIFFQLSAHEVRHWCPHWAVWVPVYPVLDVHIKITACLCPEGDQTSHITVFVIANWMSRHVTSGSCHDMVRCI